VTPEEHVVRLDKLIRIMAAERLRPDLREDAEQEARIAVWRCAIKHADDPRPLGPLLTTVARRAILGVAAGRSFTGETRKQGRKEPLRQASTEALDPADEGDTQHDPADEIALRDAVEQALAPLKPWERAYIEQHYLADRPQTDVAEALGMSVGGLANAWARRLRPQLALALNN